MSLFLRTALIALSLTGCAAAPKTRLTLSDLSTRCEIIGQLGQPLGAIMPIRAEILRGDSLHMKAYWGKYLLRVQRVGARDLPQPVITEFDDTTAALPHDDFDRYEQLHGQKAKHLSGQEVAELDRGYVGQRLDLLVYETGGYTGLPDRLPEEFTWSGQGWHFETRLVVLKILRPQE